MDDLVTWLRAAWDEDERVARQMTAEPGGFYIEAETDATNIMTVGAHLYRWTPKRVLTEVDAKRRILDLHAPQPTNYVDGRYVPGEPTGSQCGYCAGLCHSHSGLSCDSPDAPYPCDTVRLLVLPMAEREGYREEWRP